MYDIEYTTSTHNFFFFKKGESLLKSLKESNYNLAKKLKMAEGRSVFRLAWVFNLRVPCQADFFLNFTFNFTTSKDA